VVVAPSVQKEREKSRKVPKTTQPASSSEPVREPPPIPPQGTPEYDEFLKNTMQGMIAFENIRNGSLSSLPQYAAFTNGLNMAQLPPNVVLPSHTSIMNNIYMSNPNLLTFNPNQQSKPAQHIHQLKHETVQKSPSPSSGRKLSNSSASSVTKITQPSKTIPSSALSQKRNTAQQQVTKYQSNQQQATKYQTNTSSHQQVPPRVFLPAHTPGSIIPQSLINHPYVMTPRQEPMRQETPRTIGNSTIRPRPPQATITVAPSQSQPVIARTLPGSFLPTQANQLGQHYLTRGIPTFPHMASNQGIINLQGVNLQGLRAPTPQSQHRQASHYEDLSDDDK